MNTKWFLWLIGLVTATGLVAQTQDPATVYSEFSRQSTILQAAAPHSVEYEQARQAMLQMYPQLYNQAASLQKTNTNNSLVFARAYVDMANMPQFEDMQLQKSDKYPTMVYFVASGYYNKKDYVTAAQYLRQYITCGAQQNRLTVYQFLIVSLEKSGKQDEQFATIDEALQAFPTNQNLLALGINSRLEKGMYAEALVYVNKALAVRPGDAKLTSLKGQCLEGQGFYEQAAGVYELLAGQQKSLNIYKHYALNLFNCGVALHATSTARAIEYFKKAIPVLQQVVANDPTSAQYTSALAMCYLYTDQYDELQATNDRLLALGAQPVGTGATNQSMQLMTSDLKQQQAPLSRPSDVPSEPMASSTPAPSSQAPQTEVAQAPKRQSDYQAYMQTYIEKEINLWQQKDPYETIDEYTSRVTEQTRNEMVNKLMTEAKQNYLDKHKRLVKLSDFTLQPYDAENGVFLINSRYGDLILPVPRANQEARSFAEGWKTVSLENPQLDIAGNELVIRSVDFITKTGRLYHYSDQDEAKYAQADINLQFNDIDYSGLEKTSGAAKNKVQVQKQNVTVGESDVDVNIPETKTVRSKTFAFVIGNENYQSVSPVPFALRDAQSMATYFQKALGIPQSNIRVYQDATFGKVLACVRDIKSIAAAYNSEIDIIFYYAGHGIPDEKSKSAYLLPVDADGTQTETCYSIGRLYQELGQLGAHSVIVLMDACFSGSQRGEGMLASARGVALKAKADVPQGKMLTLSAATGEETAYPYEEKQHGMFSYYVMKHLQNTKGRTTLGDLADFVQTQVRQQSVVINLKSQTPTVCASAEAQDWRRWSWK